MKKMKWLKTIVASHTSTILQLLKTGYYVNASGQV